MRGSGATHRQAVVPAVGRTFFALGIVGLGVQHFVFGDFVTGRAPAWPASLPGGTIWAYLTGSALIVMAATVGRHARYAALSMALLLFVWAWLRHIPILLASAPFEATWTQAGKALTLFGGALAVAARADPVGDGGSSRFTRLVNQRGAFILVCRVCLGLFLVVTGVQHFIYTEFVASLIPAWFPGDATGWTYAAGVALVAGGIGINVPLTGRLAALLVGLMVFSWFWIVHIPRTFASVSDGLAVFEALAVSGIAFMLAGWPRTANTLRDRARRPDALTGALLGCGMAAGPLYLIVGYAQALTRDGFDMRRHALSLLSNGELGWIQIANFVGTGLLVIAGAIGMRRALAGSAGGTGGPLLLAAYGLGLIGAGFFPADPGAGFPPGLPEPTGMSRDGLLHFVFGGSGFYALIAACLVFARRFHRARETAWAAYSAFTAAAFFASFAAIASGSTSPTTILAFYGAVTWVSLWLAAVHAEVLGRAAGRDGVRALGCA